MLTVPKIVPKLLTNGAYGAPPWEGPPNPRRMTPSALACVHITANPNTPPASATSERNYANREGSGGPSAHFYIDRTGVVVQAIDWREFPAWSNGDVKNPNVQVPGIQKVVDARAKGFNANECYGIEIENVGREPEYPITVSQIRSNAYLVALARLEWPELPISRATVHGHRYLNTIDKVACPTRGDLEALLDEIIGLASDYYEVMALQAVVAEQETAIGFLRGRVDSLTALTTAQGLRIDEQTAQIGTLGDALVELRNERIAWIEYRDAMRSDAGESLARKSPVEEGA